MLLRSVSALSCRLSLELCKCVGGNGVSVSVSGRFVTRHGTTRFSLLAAVAFPCLSNLTELNRAAISAFSDNSPLGSHTEEAFFSFSSFQFSKYQQRCFFCMGTRNVDTRRGEFSSPRVYRISPCSYFSMRNQLSVSFTLLVLATKVSRGSPHPFPLKISTTSEFWMNGGGRRGVQDKAWQTNVLRSLFLGPLAAPFSAADSSGSVLFLTLFDVKLSR